MATTKPVSGQAENNAGMTILQAGNSTATYVDNLSLANNLTNEPAGSKVHLATAPSDSGNVGGIKALSAGRFAQMETGKYVGKIIGDRIAQTDNTTLKSPGSDVGNNDSLHYGTGNRRYHITAWDYATGVATKGGSAGAAFTYYDPENDTAIGSEPRPTRSVPGEITYQYGSLTPVMTNYKASTS